MDEILGELLAHLSQRSGRSSGTAKDMAEETFASSNSAHDADGGSLEGLVASGSLASKAEGLGFVSIDQAIIHVVLQVLVHGTLREALCVFLCCYWKVEEVRVNLYHYDPSDTDAIIR